MATADEIANLRLLIAEDTEDRYTDDALGVRIDAAASLDRVAYDIWTEKAAYYTALVDKSEGGSSRSNGALQEKALKMVAMFERRLGAVSTSPETPVARVIVSQLRR